MRSSRSLIWLVALGLWGTGVAGEFHALREDYAAKAAVLESLTRLVVEGVSIDGKPAAEALGHLNDRLGRSGKARVNFVVRMPRVEGGGDDPFASGDPLAPEDHEPWQPKPVTLEVERIDFATAVDRICRQAGFRWAIEFRDGTRIPIVVLSADG